MIIVNEKKLQVKEAKGKIVTSFEVNYWGAKVTYSVYQTPTGAVYYKADGNGDHYAATILANKAAEMFIMAQKKAGINPVFRIGGQTSKGFIPTSTELR